MSHQKWLCCLFLPGLLISSTATAQISDDDTQLFRSSSAEPYVMVLLDTSGSMRGVRVPGGADDPDSRMFQAKAAIYEVVRDLPSETKLGFATFAQPNAEVFRKHYLYQRAETHVDTDFPWFTDLAFLAAGEPVEFGQPILDGGDPAMPSQTDLFTYLSCQAPDVAGTDAIRLRRLHRFPKLGDDGTTSTTLYSSIGGQTYRVVFTGIAAGELGHDTIDVVVDVDPVTWNGTACVVDPLEDNAPVTVTFEPLYTDFNLTGDPANPQMAELFALNPDGSRRGFDFLHKEVDNLDSTSGFPVLSIQDYIWDNPCGGWEANNNTAEDGAFTVATFQDPQTAGARPAAVFDRGDMIPWDWVSYPETPPALGFDLNSRDAILRRLAPNVFVRGEYQILQPDGTEVPDDPAQPAPPFTNRVPDFRVARYFEDIPGAGGQLALLPQFAETPPITGDRPTPLGAMLDDFGQWYDTWVPIASDPVTGDDDFRCRPRFVILITDGVETCGGNAPAAAAALRTRNPGVRTFVIGFGDSVTAGNLQAISDNGGTGGGMYNSYVDVEDRDGDGDTADIVEDCYEFGICTEIAPGVQTGVLLAGDRAQLAVQLRSLFTALASEPATFSPSGLPSGQAGALDSVFRSQFLPLRGEGTWSGHLSHIVRFDENEGPPDNCVLGTPSALFSDRTFVPLYDNTRGLEDTGAIAYLDNNSCFAWDAGDVMRTQAATIAGCGLADSSCALEFAAGNFDPTTVDTNVLNLGIAPNERRVLYSRITGGAAGFCPDITAASCGCADPLEANCVPDQRLFEPQTTLADQNDMFVGFGLSLANPLADLINETNVTIAETLRLREELDPNRGSETFEFVLGDIFHSNSLVIGAPNRSDYFVTNRDDDPFDGSTCAPTDPNDENCYRGFTRAHRLRRRVLLVGSNDGQLHAFDAGLFDVQTFEDPRTGDESLDGNFTVGSGRELFSYVPRLAMPTLQANARDERHRFSVDAPLVADDFFVNGQWRTVVIGGMRRGGQGYFALDVTQPDALTLLDLQGLDNDVPVPDIADVTAVSATVPSCFSLNNGTVPSGCRDIYPRALWEFTDSSDFDGNGHSDLSFTWSTPGTGLIRLCAAGTAPCTDPDDFVERYVAIFGGGVDPDNLNLSGDWLYMVDVETGKILYKRQLMGSAPSDPVVLDLNGDSILDRVYIGTTAGYLYKVDLSVPVEISATGMIEDSAWSPFVMFRTFDPAGTGGEERPRPIYYRPSVIFVPNTNTLAIAFGTGDRANLWSRANPPLTGRFYVFLDQGSGLAGDFTSTDTPFDDTTFPVSDGITDHLLTSGGFVIRLDEHERLTGNPFALGGITTFVSYVPDFTVDPSLTCERMGRSRANAVFTLTGRGVFQGNARYIESTEGLLGTPGPESGELNEADFTGDPGEEAEFMRLEAIKEELERLLPENCRFTNKTINIRADRTDTEVVFIAPVPVCTIESNWKSF